MLRLEGLEKRFGDVVAVADLWLDVGRGELLTLLGPSGCGKTTTLRMIAGFETASSGRLLLDGRDVTSLPPQRRGTGMVFQNYALFPHLDVHENVAFGLKAQGVPRAEIPRRVERSLELVDLPGYGKRKVQQLSGGQQQRVALARALAPEPPVLLLDEPLSNLDAALRERTRSELRTLLKSLGITSIFVTHDQEEAFALSDRIALLRSGRLQQVGTPEELYSEPANTFVASFLGRASLLPARIVAAEGEMVLCELAGGARWRAARGGIEAVPDAEVRLMLRPEAVALTAGGADEAGSLPGRVVERQFAGATTLYRIETPAGEVLAQAGARAAAPGDAVRLRPGDGSAPRLFPAREPGAP
ncbi:MAG TPA: ABC transporter ATP-binding protein [Longimicrobiales bacterium]|nr:ABC transporter ATP-binding protein [Longimicrobiales bacterium]